MKLTPAILTDSMVVLQEQLNAVRLSPLVEAAHIDIIDGQFVDNLTVTPLDLTVAEFSPLKLDFHLMVEEPMDFVYECEGVREYLPIRRLTAQVERMSYQEEFVREVKTMGWEPVLGLDLYTPLDAVDDHVWHEIKTVHLMGIEAGYQGKELKPLLFEKIRELRQLFSADRVQIIVDGGVKEQNIAALAEAGVDEVAVGSALWKSEEPLLEIEKLLNQSGNS